MRGFGTEWTIMYRCPSCSSSSGMSSSSMPPRPNVAHSPSASFTTGIVLPMKQRCPDTAMSACCVTTEQASYSHAHGNPSRMFSECARQNVNCSSFRRRVEQLSGQGAVNPQQSSLSMCLRTVLKNFSEFTT